MGKIAHIPIHMVNRLPQMQDLKHRRLGRRFQRIAGYLRPRQMEDADQPASLKACVTGHKDPFSFIKIKKFHGFPLFNYFVFVR